MSKCFRNYTCTNEAAAGLTGRNGESDMKILVAEDNEMCYDVLKELLELKGISSENACDGSMAVEMVKNVDKGAYDAILMDIRMPVMNGYDAARKIRSLGSDYAKNVPIIALTADYSQEEVKKFYEAGMTDYLVKPYDARLLYEKLKCMCENDWQNKKTIDKSG